MSYVSVLNSKLGLTLNKEASDIRWDVKEGFRLFLQCFTSLTPMNTCDPTVINKSVS